MRDAAPDIARAMDPAATGTAPGACAVGRG